MTVQDLIIELVNSGDLGAEVEFQGQFDLAKTDIEAGDISISETIESVYAPRHSRKVILKP